MLPKVVALNECLDVLSQLPQVRVLVRLDRGLLDGSIHAFEHAVRPRVVRLIVPFLNAIELADALKDVTDACVSPPTSKALLSREGHAVIRENGMDSIGEGHKYLPKELRGIGFRGPVKESEMREFCD